MTAEIELYEAAFLCGGPDRAARTALVALCTSGAVEMGGSPTFKLVKKQRRGSSDVEVAMLDKISGAGLPVKLVLKTTTDSPAVRGHGATLIAEKLLKRSLRGQVARTRAGEEMRERLIDNTPEDADDTETGPAERFAVHGVDGLPEGPLREALESLADEAEFPMKLAKSSGRTFDDRGNYSPSDTSSGGAY
ncbi:TIGR04222 domain-containing membrane protein [Spirillospora sp. NPDC047279]|uniref:TIGR04222 domain-containing membrane protein n=1 Tax=Spirillospora sp. NPDC047279 TaxID=3155478 RepID=UPI0034102F49